MNTRFLLTKTILVATMLFFSARGFSQVKLDYSATPKTQAKGQSFKGLTPESARFLILLHQSETAAKATERSAATKRLHNNYGVTKGCVSATIVLATNRNQEELKAYDVEVGCSYGGVLTARIPLSRFAELAASGICESIDVGSKMTPLMEKARNNLGIDGIHQGLNLPQGYDGTGVVVGIIDDGFEFCHPAFYDATGTHLRIKRVWNQTDESGTAPEGYSYGSEYTTEAQMIEAFTDDSTSFHGTHVLGIAAGCGAPSGRGMAYCGIAPGADIVLVPVVFNTTNVLDAINYIHEYAQSVNKPCVINMSLGTLGGPHDGTADYERFITSFMEQNTDSIALVVSAGNSGDAKIHIEKQFSASDTLVTTTVGYVKYFDMDGIVDLWAEQNFSVAFSLVNTDTNEQEDFTGFFTTGADTIITTALVATNGRTINCEFHFSEINPYNNLYNAFLNFYTDTVPERREVIMTVTSETDNLLHAWGNNLKLIHSKVVEGTVEGNSQYSIGGIGANTDAVISVGSYVTCTKFNSYEGSPFSSGSPAVGGISVFSSIGPTRDGRVKPDIVAPGEVICAPYTRYAGIPVGYAICDTVQWNGYTERYAALAGTSMSAPVVTGIVALWMQHNPSLGIEELRTIVQTTAHNDRFTGNVIDSPNNIWGHGKVNAYGGLPATDTPMYLVNAIGIEEKAGAVDGGGVLTQGTHTLTPIPAAMYSFVQWEDGNTDNPRVVDISCDTTFIAFFQPLQYEDCDTISEFPWEAEFDDNLTCWKNIDADGNGSSWQRVAGGVMSLETSSYIDNWLVSPAIEVNGNLIIKVHLRTSSASILSHDLSVQLSTSGSEIEDFTTTLFHQTYRGSGVEDDFEISLSDFEGQVVRIALRQHNNMSYSLMTLVGLSIEPAPLVFEKEIAAYTGNGGYYLIASPIGTINPEDVADMLDNDFDLFYFDEAQELEWINYKTGSFDLEAGKGYLYANSEDVVLSFIGTQYNGTGEVTMSRSGSGRFEGWNLVGNPFSENVYIDRDFYIMNEEGSEIIPASDIERDYIEPMEGVFVVAEQDQETMTFSTTAPDNKSPMIALNLRRGGVSTGSTTAVIDRAIVRFGEDRVLPKFQLRSNSTKIYIPKDNMDYAVVHADYMGEMPVNFKAKENGTYTLSLNSEGMEFSYLHLIDNMTGNDVDLLQTPSYSFEAKTTDYASRFKLVFAVNDGPSIGSGAFAFISNGNIIVTAEGILQVIDMTGRTLVCTDVARNVSTNGMPAGVYVLRLINGDDVKTQKMVIP